MTEYRTISNNIMLIITLDLLYNDFKITIAPFLYFGDKDLKEI